MNDGQALLRAVIAAPDDDAPRLVYADWLDEHASTGPCAACTDKNGFCWGKVADCRTCHGVGEITNGFAERAEFIRVQCELARHLNIPHSIGRLACGCRICHLRRRERELHDAPTVGEDGRTYYSAAYVWSGREIRNIHDWLHGSNPPTFRRGFIHSLTCAAADCLAHLDAIRERHPVREVKLTTWPETVVRELLAAEWPGITFHLPAYRVVTSPYMARQGEAAVVSRNVGTREQPIWEPIELVDATIRPG